MRATGGEPGATVRQDIIVGLATCVIAACVIVAVGTPARGAETDAWPSLRGPGHDGHVPAAEIVDAFPPEGPPVAWTRPLGAGYSGFAADGDRAYTQYQTLGGQYVLCLNAATGETVWEHRYEGPYDPAGLYPGPRATPTLGQRRVYFAGPSGLVGCLDAATGRRVWSLNVFERFGVEPVEFGYSCGPTLTDGKLLVPVGAPGASLVALDPATGAVLWKSGDDAISHVPALPVTFRGRRLAIGYLRNVLAAFDVGTGEVLWRMSLSTGYDEHAAWPVYSEPYLWISAPFQAGSELIELTGEQPGHRTVWKSRLMSNDVCSSVLVDGRLYGFDIRDVQAKPHRPSRGAFRCVEFLTGRERWSNGTPDERRRVNETGPGTAIGQATVLVADGKFVLFNELGELILASVNPDRYEELGRVRVLGGELGWTQPTLHRGRLFVRNHSRAACVLLGREAVGGSEAGAPRLTVADIPRSTYRDWAGALIPIEPEYAMDAPSPVQLREWYEASLAGYVATALIAGFVQACVVGVGRLRRRALPPVEAKLSPNACRSFQRLHGVLTAAFGLAGTTLFGVWGERFIFTWPLCLFAAFQATVYASRVRGDPAGRAAWRGYLVLGLFVAMCAAYFLVCRRLSLAFEWAFLVGFPAAVPPLLLARRPSPFGASGEVVLGAVAFSAYYWASAGFMIWRYAG